MESFQEEKGKVKAKVPRKKKKIGENVFHQMKKQSKRNDEERRKLFSYQLLLLVVIIIIRQHLPAAPTIQHH